MAWKVHNELRKLLFKKFCAKSFFQPPLSQIIAIKNRFSFEISFHNNWTIFQFYVADIISQLVFVLKDFSSIMENHDKKYICNNKRKMKSHNPWKIHLKWKSKCFKRNSFHFLSRGKEINIFYSCEIFLKGFSIKKFNDFARVILFLTHISWLHKNIIARTNLRDLPNTFSMFTCHFLTKESINISVRLRASSWWIDSSTFNG